MPARFALFGWDGRTHRKANFGILIVSVFDTYYIFVKETTNHKKVMLEYLTGSNCLAVLLRFI